MQDDTSINIHKLYQQGANELPDAALDQRILQQAQQAIKKTPPIHKSPRFWQKNKIWLGSAASVLLAFLLFNQYRDYEQFNRRQLTPEQPLASLPQAEELVTQSNAPAMLHKQRAAKVQKHVVPLPPIDSVAGKLSDAPAGASSILTSDEVLMADRTEMRTFAQQTDSEMLAVVKSKEGLMGVTPDNTELSIELETRSQAAQNGESQVVSAMSDRAESAPNNTDSEWQRLRQQITQSSGQQKRQLQQRYYEQLVEYVSADSNNRVKVELLQALNTQQQAAFKRRFIEQVVD